MVLYILHSHNLCFLHVPFGFSTKGFLFGLALGGSVEGKGGKMVG